jgi:hypothetical protein
VSADPDVCRREPGAEQQRHCPSVTAEG